MSVQMILLPLFVQVLLTITLGLMMAVRRRKALMSRETRWQDIALREPGWPKDAIAVGNAWLISSKCRCCSMCSPFWR